MTIKEMQDCKKNHGLSYAEIAEQSGVPFGTVQKVLSGKTKSPRHRTLTILEDYFHSIQKVRHKDDSCKIPVTYSGDGYEDTSKGEPPAFLSEAQISYAADAKGSPDQVRTNSKYPDQGNYQLSDYLSLPDHQRAELIDGIFYDMSAPSAVHQIICAQLGLTFADFIESRNGSCEVLFSPIAVQLDKDNKTIVEPDLCVICNPDIIQKDRICGAPDLIVEVLSPSTRRKDMTVKLLKYLNAGVMEYWIVDPENKMVAVYDFSCDMKLSVYSFHDHIPAGIYQGELVIDFEKIQKRIERFL